ncbi:MAG: hypothetical protein ACYC09_06550 [Bacteroidota bacterium]
MALDESVNSQKNNSVRMDQSQSDSDASFFGWQEGYSGESVALYNITAQGHPSFGSTVSEKSLRKLNLRVPNTP